MLRDAWYSAWRKSEQELLETPVLYRGSKGKTVLDLLTSVKRVELGQDVGKPVIAIGATSQWSARQVLAAFCQW